MVFVSDYIFAQVAIWVVNTDDNFPEIVFTMISNNEPLITFYISEFFLIILWFYSYVNLGVCKTIFKNIGGAAVFGRDGYLISVYFKVFLWEWNKFSRTIAYELMSSLGW